MMRSVLDGGVGWCYYWVEVEVGLPVAVAAILVKVGWYSCGLQMVVPNG